jgi:hypothetical protein
MTMIPKCRDRPSGELGLCAVLERCPDWDISSANLRAAWAKGGKASFPNGKTQPQVFAEQN